MVDVARFSIVQDVLIPDLLGLGQVYTHEGVSGGQEFLYNYFMDIIGEDVDTSLVYGIMIAKDGEQETDHDPGGMLRRQLAIDTVSCGGLVSCGDYIVEDVFFVDEAPYAAAELASGDPEYIWPWPQYCEPLDADGYASGEFSCWILGIPLEYYVTYSKIKMRMKDDVNNWRRVDVYDYDNEISQLWIQPPDDEEMFCDTDVVEFVANIMPSSLEGLLPYVEWLPVYGDGTERLPYDQYENSTGYQSEILTPFVGSTFSISLKDEDFWVKASWSYCTGISPPPEPKTDIKHVRLFSCERYGQMLREGAVFRQGQAVNLTITWSPDTHFYSRQYINWPADPQASWQGRIIYMTAVVGGSCSVTNLSVEFSYSDPPLRSQGRAFPWINPNDNSTWPDPNDPNTSNPNPHDDDNMGGYYGQTSGYQVGLDFVKKHTVQVQSDRTASATFFTSWFGGDNYNFVATLLCGSHPSVTSGEVDVWRFYGLFICEMTPDFLPEFGSIGVAFNEAFIESRANPDVPVTPVGSDLDYGTGDVEGNNVIDYADDIIPLGDENDHFQHIIYFHDPLDDYYSPKNAIHIQGIDNFITPHMTGHCAFFGGTPLQRDRHKHCFIAVGEIRNHFGQDAYHWNLRTVIHELGHGIGG